MLIQPDTYIRLIKNCPLDKTYDHTLYFDSEAQQVAYFKNTLQGIPFTKQSYQRYDKGVLHIQEKAENLYACNYLMFQNTAFGNKWFYAFVTSIEYVNNVSTRVTYEIDVMQTWFFDYTIADSFVEREHSITDNIGDNLVPESLEVGEFFVEKLDVPNCPFTAGEYHVIVVQGTNKLKVNDEYQAVVSNVFSGLDFTRYSTPSEAYEALKTINNEGKSDSVVAVFMIPRVFWGGASVVDFSDANVVLNVSDGLSDPYSDNFDGYEPKNNKLYTAPYFGLIGTSSSGDEHRYAYEYFDDPSKPVFGVSFSVGASPEAVITPYKYKGTYSANYNEEMICKDFPQCAYATDTFKAYIAQNSGRLLAGLASQVLNTGNAQGRYINAWNNPGMSMGQVDQIGREGASDLASYIFNVVGTIRDVSILPPKVRGSGASYINYTRNTVGFMFYKYKIRREFAEIIDGYFNMFGYATNRVKQPNRNSRPHWNYVKTRGCVLHSGKLDSNGVLKGGLPADDMAKIHAIYDNGITFWKNGSEVGDYSLNNQPE